MAIALVTGAAGFIGSHVADLLITMGHEVIAIDDLSGGRLENVNPKALFFDIDIQDAHKIEALFNTYEINYVYHFAAYAAEGLSHFIRNFNYSNNVIGSVNLINLAVKYNIKCFVFASSIAVYGKNQLPFTENITPLPEDPYGIAKYAVELDLKAAHEMFGLNHVIFRPHNVYGERQNIGDKYRNVVGIFMNKILNEAPLPIFGDGNQTRSFSYIHDIVAALTHAAFMPQTYNEVYNIGADEICTVGELAKIIAQTFNVNADIKYLEARKEVVHAQANHDKAITAFKDLIRHTPLEVGIAKMALWAKAHGHQPTKRIKSIEIEKNLPESWR